MATLAFESGSFWVRVGYSVSQSVANNRSTITITSLEVNSKSGYIGQAYVWGSVYVNDSTALTMGIGSNGPCGVGLVKDSYAGVNISPAAKNAVTVTHDSTGKKTVPIRLSITVGKIDGTSYGKNTSTENAVLPQIAQKHTLTISSGTGSTITVNRTSSPKAGAATGSISSNAVIYDGDVLKISVAASTGYEVKYLLVNDAVFTSGNSKTVSGDISVVSSAALQGTVHIGSDRYFAEIADNGTVSRYVPYIGDGTNWVRQT